MIKFGGRIYTYEGTDFDLGAGIIELMTGFGGSFFTGLSISPLDYRSQHTSNAKITYKITKKQTMFLITNDWGTESEIIMDNTHKDLIRKSIKRIKEEKLCFGCYTGHAICKKCKDKIYCVTEVK